jgi:GcrA cell cycle regulator
VARTDYWAETVIDKLRELAITTMSTREIAHALNVEFGTVLTKNAVIGKINRLGFRPKRQTPRREPKPTIAIIARVKREPRNNFNFHRQRYNAQITPLAPVPIEPIEPVGRCTLLELTNKTCRWPIGNPGEPGFLFCGSPKANMEKNRPYCRYHSAHAYQQR